MVNCAPESIEDAKEPINDSTTITTVQDLDTPIPLIESPPILINETEIGPEGTYKERHLTFMLRPTKNGAWRFLTEGKHEKSPYVDKVITYHDRIVVKYKSDGPRPEDSRKFSQIFGFTCSVDMQLMGKKVQCGLSGVVSEIVIKFAVDGRDGYVDPSELVYPDSNITIMVHGYDTIE